jgi:hypothetical protein
MKNILWLPVMLILIGCGNSKPEVVDIDNVEESPSSKVSTISDEDIENNYYRTEALIEQLVGTELTSSKNDFSLGNSETLDGTNGSKWLSYFSDIDATILIDKSSNLIVNVCAGKNQRLLNDKSISLRDKLGKKFSNEEYVDIISSARYGKIERLGEKNCMNKDCIEYYGKGNFTTMAYYKFGDEGDYVEFKRIGFGNLPNLASYNEKDVKAFYLKKTESSVKSDYNEKVENNTAFKELRQNGKVIGKWYVKNKYTTSANYQFEIYEKEGKLYSVMIRATPIIKGLTKKGDKYFENDNNFGEYVTINGGKLKLFDSDGEFDDNIITPLK